ncbi:MAG: response regulator [Verrucomicrobiota bacterium]
MAHILHTTPPPRPLILLVEDFVGLRKMLTTFLEHQGYQTLELNSGDEVLTVPRETLMAAECAFVDDSLCGNLTGMQTVVMLHLINPNIKIFPIPGRPLTDYERALIAQHHRQILFKPFNIEVLLAAVKKATEPSVVNQSLPRPRRWKIIPALIKALQYAVLLGLLGLIGFFFSLDPDFHRVFLPSAKLFLHWLGLGGIVAAVLTVLLWILTVGAFAFNSDWLTRDGILNLVLCMFLEALGLAVLAGLYVLVVAGLHLGR